jgi:signal transduction histidine kinase
VFIAGFFLLLISGLFSLFIPGLEGNAHWAPFVIHLTVLLSSLTIGMGPALASNNDRVLDALRRHLDRGTIDALRVESELVVLARKVASRLHAENRGEFMARILRLQQALDRGETEEALTEIRAVREALSAQRESDDDIHDDDLVRFLQNWRGLVDINTNLHTVSVPDHLHPAINTVVMDAVNDAVRHGQADWIEVQLDTDGNQAVLTVSNNGRQPDEAFVRGMGGATLDRLATRGWSREVDVLGFTRLTARFRLD